MASDLILHKSPNREWPAKFVQLICITSLPSSPSTAQVHSTQQNRFLDIPHQHNLTSRTSFAFAWAQYVFIPEICLVDSIISLVLAKWDHSCTCYQIITFIFVPLDFYFFNFWLLMQHCDHRTVFLGLGRKHFQTAQETRDLDRGHSG